MASLTPVSYIQPQTASAVPVPLASSARMVLPSDQDQVLTAAAAPHIPSSSGESKSKAESYLNELQDLQGLLVARIFRMLGTAEEVRRITSSPTAQLFRPPRPDAKSFPSNCQPML